MKPDAFLGLPRGRHAWMAVGFALSFQALWLLLYGGADWLAAHMPWRLEVGMAWEQRIPFVAAAALVYLSMGLMLGLLPFALRRWQDLFPVWVCLCAETAVAALCFVLLPVRTSFPPREAGGWTGAVFDFADTLNLSNNFLPSLHVAFAVTAALALQARTGRAARVGLWAWAGAIAASTLLMHEHQLLDVFAGVLLAAACWHACHRRAGRPAVLQAVQIEVLCLRDLVLFTRRHRRYGPIAIAVLAAGLPRWRERRLLRLGFCFLQHVDDVLDGDRPTAREPLEIIDELTLAMRTGSFGDSELMQMAQALYADLMRAGGPAAVDKTLGLVAVMRRDRERALTGALMSRAELQAHHRATFVASIDLALLACGSKWTAAQVPELVELLAWCSPMRDLENDLAAGLVNFPRELLGTPPLPPFKTLINQPAIRQWLMDEQRDAAALLPRLAERLAQLRLVRRPGNVGGWRALAVMAAAIRLFARRQLPRLYPFLADVDAMGKRA